MAILPILTYPDPRLREKTRPVAAFDEALGKLLDDLAETMYAAPGVGLAANQVGVPLRVAVIDIASPKAGTLYELVNPRLVSKSDPILWNEGCLSFPDVTEEIERSAKAVVEAFDRHGKPFRLEGSDLLAVAIQHEIDHLDGVLILDHLSYLRKRLVRRKLARARKDAAGSGEET